jgi:hypothetical protein
VTRLPRRKVAAKLRALQRTGWSDFEGAFCSRARVSELGHDLAGPQECSFNSTGPGIVRKRPAGASEAPARRVQQGHQETSQVVQLFRVHVRYTNSLRRRSVGPEEPESGLPSRGRAAGLPTASTVDQTTCTYAHRCRLRSICTEADLQGFWLPSACLRPKGRARFPSGDGSAGRPQGRSSGLDRPQRGSHARRHT